MSQAGLSEDVVAARSGASLEFVRHLLELGIVAPEPGIGLTEADVRRVRVVEALDGAGLSLDGLAEAMRSGFLSLDFVEQPAYHRFDSLTETTFREVSEARGIPLDLLLVVREAAGGPEAGPDDRVRESELPVIAAGEVTPAQRGSAGDRGVVVARLRREPPADGRDRGRLVALRHPRTAHPGRASRWPRSVVARPPSRPSSRRRATRPSWPCTTRHQANAWMRNIFEGFEAALASQGLQSRVERPPAIAFLDISGYTRLTEERGDEAARDLATSLGQIVRRTSAQHGGRTVKWLGRWRDVPLPGAFAGGRRVSRDDEHRGRVGSARRRTWASAPAPCSRRVVTSSGGPSTPRRGSPAMRARARCSSATRSSRQPRHWPAGSSSRPSVRSS